MYGFVFVFMGSPSHVTSGELSGMGGDTAVISTISGTVGSSLGSYV